MTLASESLQLDCVDALDTASVEYLATTQGMQGGDEAMRELLTIAGQVGHGGIDVFEAILARRRADWPGFECAMGAYARNTDRDAGWMPAYARGAACGSRYLWWPELAAVRRDAGFAADGTEAVLDG